MNPSDRNQSHHNLLDAFAKPGCPICGLGLAAVVRYFGVLDYEAAGDPGVRLRLRATQGFCAQHAHQLVEEAHVLAVATIYAEVLPDLIETLRTLPFRRRPLLGGLTARLRPGVDGSRVAGNPHLAPTAPCPACDVLAKTEEMLVSTLLDSLGEAAFRDTFAASDGLCLPHLRQALGRATNERAFAALRDAALAQEERLLAQLREIIRKHDYRFREQLVGEERGAGERAARHVAGAAAAFSDGART